MPEPSPTAPPASRPSPPAPRPSRTVQAPTANDGWRMRFADLLGTGDDLKLQPHEQRFADALDGRARRRVRSAVYRGRPVWDGPSAQYAAVVGRATDRLFALGPAVMSLLFLALAVLLLWGTVDILDEGDVLLGICTGSIGVFFAGGAVFTPYAVVNARKARKLNAHLLPDDFAFTAPTPERRGKRWRRIASTAAGSAIGLFLVRLVAFDDPLIAAAGAAVFTGLLFALGGEVFAAYAARRQSRRERSR